MIHKTPGQNIIPCPVCKTHIPFDPLLLIRGVSYPCPNCSSIVGIATESKTNAQSAYDEMVRKVGVEKSNKK